MKFHHLIEKLSAYQAKLVPGLEALNAEGKLPEDLAKTINPAIEWTNAVYDLRLGEAEVPIMTPDIDPMLAFSNKMSEYRNLFDNRMISDIEEYTELTETLFQMVKEADVKSA